MDSSADGPWGFLGIVGTVGLCCIGTAGLAGGAAVAGGTAIGATAGSSAAGGLGGILVSALVTALPLIGIGLVLQRRTQR